MPLFSHYEPLADISVRLSIPALVFSIVTPLIVICRFIARSINGGNLGTDDWTILASLVFTETVNIQMIICCEWAFGKHTKLLDSSVVRKTLKLYWFAQILYKISIGLTKVSILTFYLRVFGPVRWFRRLCFAILGLVIAFSIASVVTSIFQCSPVKFAFDKSGHGTCIDLGKFWHANAGYNIGTDAIIIAMPALVISTLQLPKRTKVALCGVFALGIFVCVTSILRVTTLNISTAHTDTMWQSVASSMWTVIESNLGIIVACMPALRRPIVMFFPRLLGKMGRTAAHASEGHQNTNPSWTTAALELSKQSKQSKRLHSRGSSYDRNASWPDDEDAQASTGSHTNNTRFTQQAEVYEGEEMGDTSDGDRGSDHHILKDNRNSSRKYSQTEITKTTEVRVDMITARDVKPPHYYPG